MGASLLIQFDDNSEQLGRYHNDGSYLSGNDPRVIIKWQGNKKLKQVEITWPDGQNSILNAFKMNQYQQVSQP